MLPHQVPEEMVGEHLICAFGPGRGEIGGDGRGRTVPFCVGDDGLNGGGGVVDADEMCIGVGDFFDDGAEPEVVG